MLSKSKSWSRQGMDLLRSRSSRSLLSCTRPAGAAFHSSSFVSSSHGEPEKSKTKIKSEIMSLLSALQTRTRVNSSGYLEVKECHLCDKGHKTKSDNLYKLNIRADGGYYCFRCSCGGNYSELKQKLQSAVMGHHGASPVVVHHNSSSNAGTASLTSPATTAEQNMNIDTTSTPIVHIPKLPKSILESDEAALKSENVRYLIPDQTLSYRYFLNLFPPEEEGSTEGVKQESIPDQDVKVTKMAEYRRIVKEYLHDKRGLDDEVLRKYQVGFAVQQFLIDNEEGESEWQDQICITFPWIQFADQIVSESGKVKDNYTFVSLDKFKNKSKKSTVPDSINMEGNNCYIMRTKYRAIQTKGLQRILPKGGSWGFFGWHLTREGQPDTATPTTPSVVGSADVAAETAGDLTQQPTETKPKKSSTSTKQKRSIIITEGEYDAMAVAQGLRVSCRANDALLKIPVISLPNGCNSLPNELVSLLDNYQQIYLWMDNDKSGLDAVEKFTRKLGMSRCLIVKPPADMMNPPKDANDALRQDPSLIPAMLRGAETISHDKIQSFAAFKHSLLANIQNRAAGHSVTSEGSTTPSLPGLTEMCKGFRRGEMVVLSGPTGSGKTTLLSQLGLDFATAGSPVLWGSFEVRNAQLSLKMLHQFTKFSSPLHSLPESDVKQIVDDFESLPIQYMNYYGSTPIDAVLETMEYAVDKDDIQHIIIDNLQFMLPRTHLKPTTNVFEKYDLQDFVLDKLRIFATTKNVNLIVVIHPKKEDDFVELGLSSIGGSAKATQEADLVLILQKPGRNGKVALDVKKNRYDGYLGRIFLQFNENNQSFSQMSEVIPYHRSGDSYASSNNNSGNNRSTESTVSNTTSTLGKKIATPGRVLWEQAMMRREQTKVLEPAVVSPPTASSVSVVPEPRVEAPVIAPKPVAVPAVVDAAIPPTVKKPRKRVTKPSV